MCLGSPYMTTCQKSANLINKTHLLPLWTSAPTYLHLTCKAIVPRPSFRRFSQTIITSWYSALCFVSVWVSNPCLPHPSPLHQLYLVIGYLLFSYFLPKPVLVFLGHQSLLILSKCPISKQNKLEPRYIPLPSGSTSKRGSWANSRRNS